MHYLTKNNDKKLFTLKVEMASLQETKGSIESSIFTKTSSQTTVGSTTIDSAKIANTK